ncbi:DUF3108 domain-containing protein [Desulforhopalus singaporensis]|uniref:DUF3108 domain-containing protein n=1 Tax=Desulforhopalus singaporensis TaxID=91360 RepID=UPI0015A21E37|nr:DUF3108 domain-containing protein [Desulforhopalus singaporensis]
MLPQPGGCGDKARRITESFASVYPEGELIETLAAVGYSGAEKIVWDLSWSGGIKLGEIHVETVALKQDGCYEIRAFITTERGAIHYIYPVSDRHVTRVRGEKKLPFYYEVWQKEGYRYQAHRIFEYDQENNRICYTKNGRLEGEYELKGEVNNEFSSFFNSRLMRLKVGRPFTVPTFADKKRVEVAVHPLKQEILEDTILGPVQTVVVLPVMTFRGLYDKTGDTVIWYTDDECRVPVQIRSKIAIGSLTARLSAYENGACTRYFRVGNNLIQNDSNNVIDGGK